MKSQKFSVSSPQRSQPTKPDTLLVSSQLSNSEIDALRQSKKSIADYVQKELPERLKKHHLEFAVLVGSRATGSAHANSDWDIALQWSAGLDWMTVLGLTEALRANLAEALNVPLVVCQDSCHLPQAACLRFLSVCRAGLSHTTLFFSQFRVVPDHRSGWLALAC